MHMENIEIKNKPKGNVETFRKNPTTNITNLFNIKIRVYREEPPACYNHKAKYV